MTIMLMPIMLIIMMMLRTVRTIITFRRGRGIIDYDYGYDDSNDNDERSDNAYDNDDVEDSHDDHYKGGRVIKLKMNQQLSRCGDDD